LGWGKGVQGANVKEDGCKNEDEEGREKLDKGKGRFGPYKMMGWVRP